MSRLLALLLLLPLWTSAQKIVRYEYRVAADTQSSASKGTVEAVLRVPAGEPNGKALVILHHKGGWGMGTTAQYGEYFSQRGFVTLEPRMFNAPSQAVMLVQAGQMIGALEYLARLPQVHRDEISVLGLSWGAFLAVYAATEWIYEAHQVQPLRFHRVASFYPTCSRLQMASQGIQTEQPIFKGMPRDFMQRWAGLEMKIFAGGLDDYEDRDPKACPDFIESIKDERQRKLMSLEFYPNATHGWDHGMNYSFYEPAACKGRGCTNTIRSDSAVTEKAKASLLDFLSRPH